jgi:hypothetical protein
MMSDERVLIRGHTNSGRTLVVYEADDPRDRRFVIDGAEADVLHQNLYCDGGTRRYTTTQGVVVFPYQLMSDDRTPRLDGERVEVGPESA